MAKYSRFTLIERKRRSLQFVEIVDEGGARTEWWGWEIPVSGEIEKIDDIRLVIFETEQDGRTWVEQSAEP